MFESLDDLATRLSATGYFIDPVMTQVVFLAAKLQKPLILEGPAGSGKRLMTLDVDEFLRRFLLHLLPPGFVRIRNFGFLANRNRATLLPLCTRLLVGSQENTATPASPSTDQIHSVWNCPVCGGTMHVVERLSAAQLLLRSPPLPDRHAV